MYEDYLILMEDDSKDLGKYIDKVKLATKKIFQKINELIQKVKSKVIEKLLKLKTLYKEVESSPDKKAVTDKEYNRFVLRESSKFYNKVNDSLKQFKSGFDDTSESEVKVMNKKILVGEIDKILREMSEEKRQKVTMSDISMGVSSLDRVVRFYRSIIGVTRSSSRAIDVAIKSNDRKSISTMYSNIVLYNGFIGKVNRYTNRLTGTIYASLKNLQKDSKIETNVKSEEERK